MPPQVNNRIKKIGITALSVTVILLALTYACLTLFFEDHYYYHTIINGTDYSYKTPVEAEELMYGNLDNFSLEITGRDNTYDIIMQADIELQYIFDDSFVTIKNKQKSWLWFLGFFKEYAYDIPKMAEYNEEALKNKINKLTFFKAENIRAPSAAYIEYSMEQEKYIITASNPGTEIDKNKVETKIKESIDKLDSELDLDEKGCYKKPAVDKNDSLIKDAADTANKYISTRITYDWNGNQVIVDKSIIREWILIDKSNVVLNEEKIKEFVAEKSKKYDTYGRNRIFHATDGREIELKSGAYGWKTNRDAETEALSKAVKGGETLEKVPEYTYTAAQSGKEDIGNTYVEIDLGKQHLYLYVDGAIVLESDFVSGNAARGWTTPPGIFGLTYKTKNAVLRGENYETPVTYWMPFNGNIGMHDAGWRSSFGGDIYMTNGSHGCVNLPPENARIIYDYVYTGFPVVCYY